MAVGVSAKRKATRHLSFRPEIQVQRRSCRPSGSRGAPDAPSGGGSATNSSVTEPCRLSAECSRGNIFLAARFLCSYLWLERAKEWRNVPAGTLWKTIGEFLDEEIALAEKLIRAISPEGIYSPLRLTLRLVSSTSLLAWRVCVHLAASSRSPWTTCYYLGSGLLLWFLPGRPD